MDEEKTSESVNNVQNIADLTSDYLVRESWENVNQAVELGTDKIKFDVKRINVSEVHKRDDWAKISLKIQENENLNETDTKVVLKSFENLGCIINSQKTCDVPNEKRRNQAWEYFSCTITIIFFYENRSILGLLEPMSTRTV